MSFNYASWLLQSWMPSVHFINVSQARAGLGLQGWCMPAEDLFLPRAGDVPALPSMTLLASTLTQISFSHLIVSVFCEPLPLLHLCMCGEGDDACFSFYRERSWCFCSFVLRISVWMNWSTKVTGNTAHCISVHMKTSPFLGFSLYCWRPLTITFIVPTVIHHHSSFPTLLILSI